MDLLAQYSDDEGEGDVGGDVKAKQDDTKAAPIIDGSDGHKKPAGAMAKAAIKPPAPVVSSMLDDDYGPGMEIMMLPAVNPAPAVDMLGTDVVANFCINPADKRILTNPSIAAMSKAMVGPVEVGKRSLEEKYQNHKMGHVEKASMHAVTFDKEYHSFQNFGYAANPARGEARGDEMLQSTEAPAQMGRTIWDKAVKRRRMTYDTAAKLGVVPEQDVADAPAAGSDEHAKWGGFADSGDVAKRIENEVKLQEEEVARQQEEERAVEGEERETKERVTSVFHGSKETDYAGRSWMDFKASAPKDVDDKQCFLPKKWVHTWQGHTMGVQQIRWYPNTAHLLLSAGMDAKIKIWDYHNQRKCLRTYMGHDQAVRDINFTADGRRFYSVSYDKNIQYWDTETGQVISTFTNKKTPFCVAVHPDPAQQNVIITGCSNKKAVQWDANTASIVQEYDEHLGAVNSVTFCEDGKRLLTTSDDKKIFVWDFGIPVVIKYIAEPTMHSVPAVAMSPNGKYLLGQSMDNKMIAYEAFGRFKFIGRKQFKGHMNSGYAITPGWSADGRWVMSGDTDGKLWFWDWQKGKNYRVLKAHDGVCINAIWHPHSTSRVVSCGWDGAIKLWD
eukprot:TRINITY_DN90583_c0_g1_i1.p1 TRINITY_DN90583_c0_g1~~TRINITY_DN90583_c0_g1_i1.p1  ORF type:complete len:614 (-),score=183.51 TRINITY_DN90583_c0_g1_i1:106-1947(-)